MSLARRDGLRDRYRLGGNLGSYQRYPGMGPDLRMRASLLRGGGLRGRDPLDSLHLEGLGRFNDPLSQLSSRRFGSDPLYDNLGPLSRIRLPDMDHLLAMRRPSYGHSYYDDIFPGVGPGLDSGCEDCRKIGRRCDLDQNHRCDGDSDCYCRSRSCRKFNSKCKKEYDFKTKYITVRGKSYAVRKSFLADSSKFEADLIKFMDKKNEEQLPDHVVGMLIDFINEETCQPNSVKDLVLMNVLASNLGVKSAVEHSLSRIKKADWEYRMGGEELSMISLVVMLSSKVDSGLETWLKKFLQYDQREEVLVRASRYKSLCDDHPELHRKLQVLMGYQKQIDDDKLPIL